MLLEHPVRGNSCDHPQCFSLEPYVMMQKVSKVNRWKCPICTKLALSLVIDDFFSAIMQEAQMLQEPEFVEIFRDGSYRIVDFEGIPATRAAKRVRTEEDDPQPKKKAKIDETLPRIEKKSDFVGSLDWPIQLD
jgi:hypothetical protein